MFFRTLATMATGFILLIATAVTPAAAGTPTEDPAVVPSRQSGFRHPGVLVDRSQLTFVRAMLRADREPWASAYAAMVASDIAAPDWQPKPREYVECGSYSNPNIGCTDERNDALAAYTNALRWVLTQDARYAEKSIAIMDAWSAVMKGHLNSNSPLQTGWAGASFSRAAELIKWTYRGGWPGQERFATMLRTVYLPMLLQSSIADKNGNWELIIMDAAIGVAVFLDDRAAFDQAVARTRARVPAYIYLTGDGPLPHPPPNGTKDTPEELIKYWQGQTTFVDGLAQETCRDFGHTGWGLQAATHVAETARLQGVDLYAEFRDRLVAGYAFHTKYDLGAAAPDWLCQGTIKPGIGPVVELAYHHYHDRLGVSMPDTKALIDRGRPFGHNYFFGWETLTHAENVR